MPELNIEEQHKVILEYYERVILGYIRNHYCPNVVVKKRYNCKKINII